MEEEADRGSGRLRKVFAVSAEVWQAQSASLTLGTKGKSLSTKLKSIQRDDKSSNKEIHTIRQTLKSLQGMKL